IRRDTELEFDCPMYHKLTIRTDKRSIKVTLDGKEQSRSSGRERGGVFENEYWVPGSNKTHKIQVTDPSDASECKGDRGVVMNQPRVLRYQCAEIINLHKVTVTATMPADFNPEDVRLYVD